jgi:hypothetical protein
LASIVPPAKKHEGLFRYSSQGLLKGQGADGPRRHVTATKKLPEPNALLKGNKPMLAPLIVDPLIASLLLLAVAWVIDILHASTHDRQSCLNSTGPIGWNQKSCPLRKRQPSMTRH